MPRRKPPTARELFAEIGRIPSRKLDAVERRRVARRGLPTTRRSRTHRRLAGAKPCPTTTAVARPSQFGLITTWACNGPPSPPGV